MVTIDNIRRTLSSFFAWLENEDYIVKSPVRRIHKVKATKKVKDWRLFNCDLYVTLKPCSICENIIKQTRIKNVYYLLDKPENKKEYNKTKFYKMEENNSKQKYAMILNQFFKKKRDNKKGI